ncbi:hypothetical protein [Synechococcus sp. A15-28]|uniref:hypothetical protein n=1 Tax=Synechococcus sp. A15-28 TaxID=1050638 RepID=UPI0016483B88|nr:hypothetical protein [Synechococcus sp. A15-28]QNI42984.1 hypothetical protein SynA1528_01962 [Synechococcus sp. A15-28]
MNHIINPILGRQIGEVYKWLCFLSYICLKTDTVYADKLDDIQYILEAVTSNKDLDLSSTAGWWEIYYEDKNCNERTTNLIKNIRSAGRENRLGLEVHKRKALAFYFSEFRGLAISLRAARDSAGHLVPQGEAEEQFNNLYAAIALRVFELSKLLAPLVETIALSNSEDVSRFSFRIITASQEELNRYRELCNLKPHPITESTSEDDRGDAEGRIHMEILSGVIEESEDRMLDQIQEIKEELLVSVEQARREVMAAVVNSSMAGHGQEQLIRESDSIQKSSSTKTIGAPLSKDQIFSKLLELRGQIYKSMSSQVQGFEHWHNILQKPIIAEICRSGCKSYAEVKGLPGFNSRILQANSSFALQEQEKEFAKPIDQVLNRFV